MRKQKLSTEESYAAGYGAALRHRAARRIREAGRRDTNVSLSAVVEGYMNAVWKIDEHNAKYLSSISPNIERFADGIFAGMDDKALALVPAIVERAERLAAKRAAQGSSLSF